MPFFFSHLVTMNSSKLFDLVCQSDQLDTLPTFPFTAISSTSSLIFVLHTCRERQPEPNLSKLFSFLLHVSEVIGTHFKEIVKVFLQ